MEVAKVEVKTTTTTIGATTVLKKECRRFIVRLTMRLSDARVRSRKTKLIYANHRPPPWLTGNDTPRSPEPIVRCLVLRSGIVRRYSLPDQASYFCVAQGLEILKRGIREGL
jgi:hypothetical protein